MPSPGSSNSQDSFPPPGSGGASMDGYGNYPSQPYAQPPVAPGQPGEYQRPPSQSNAQQTPHPSGMRHSLYLLNIFFMQTYQVVLRINCMLISLSMHISC